MEGGEGEGKEEEVEKRRMEQYRRGEEYGKVDGDDGATVKNY